MIDIEVSRLVHEVGRLLSRQEEIESIKKDKFNIFQILKLDTNETRTHSAFIAELLNPKGSHLMGDVFLQDFVNLMCSEEEFIVDRCTVNVEKHIGTISEDYLRGGRLDIAISNAQGFSITIENKIYANLQPKQLERYASYNAGKNRVLFLTLHADNREMSEYPTVKSITYEHDILLWLEGCYQKAIDYPILRESIKQYIKLIESLVGKLDDKRMNEELRQLIIDNVESSRTIALNYDAAINHIRIDFQKEVYEAINHLDLSGFSVEIGNLADKVNAQIWIKPKGHDDNRLLFGVESFSLKGNFNGRLFLGLISIGAKIDYSEFLKRIPSSSRKGWWYDLEETKDQYGQVIDFSSDLFVAKLAKDVEYREELVAVIVAQFKHYWDRHSSQVLELLRGV